MGAGKTTYAHNTFDSAGAQIIDADTEAKLLMARDSRIQRRLQDAFGASVISNGSIRTDILARAAFESAESLKTLNSIVHPPLTEYLKTLIDECAKPVCVLDAAVIPLLRIESWFDKCIWIDTPFEIRLERLKIKRADISEQELIHRMRLQEEVMGGVGGGCWVVIKSKSKSNSFYGDGDTP